MSEKEPYDPERYSLRPLNERLTEIVHEHGSTIFSYDSRSRWFIINDINVDENYRRQGIAKNMLRYSKERATKLGAEVIIAAIVSRESLDAMTAVFGEEAIGIAKKGEYETPDPDEPPAMHRRTSAMLWYSPEE